MKCGTCNNEPGQHPHMTWGGAQHYHMNRYGMRAECYGWHSFCFRLDCDCGGRSRLGRDVEKSMDEKQAAA